MSIEVKNIKAIQTLPSIGSSDADWIKWSDGLDKYGSTLGKQIFISAWTKRGSRAANTRPLRLHLKDKGIEIDESVWDKVVDIGGGVGDFFGSAFKMGKWTLIIGAVVVVGAFAFSFANSVKKTTS